MSTLLLSPKEVSEITGKKRYRSQIEVLHSMQIPFRARPDGSLVILRAVIEMELGYAPKEKKQTSPSLRVPKARSLLLCQKQ